jgi:hypothetical protein
MDLSITMDGFQFGSMASFLFCSTVPPQKSALIGALGISMEGGRGYAVIARQNGGRK